MERLKTDSRKQHLKSVSAVSDVHENINTENMNHLFIHLSVCMFVCLSIVRPVCLSVCLSIGLYVYLSVCLSSVRPVRLFSVCPSTCPSVCLSV